MGGTVWMQLMGISMAPTIPEPIEKVTDSVRQHYADIGRAGGKIGGIKRAQVLTPERRSEIARMGALARKEKLKAQE